jgi:hypothetical protein
MARLKDGRDLSFSASGEMAGCGSVEMSGVGGEVGDALPVV